MTAERCDNCRYSRPIENPSSDFVEARVVCHRNAPSGGGFGAFPLVRNNLWCGEYSISDKALAERLGQELVKHDPRQYSVALDTALTQPPSFEGKVALAESLNNAVGIDLEAALPDDDETPQMPEVEP